MKFFILFLLISFEIWGKSQILITTFDPYDQAPLNNSEKVAALLLDRFRNHIAVDVKICSLKTVFDKSFFQLEDCMKSMKSKPHLILGLGEVNCSLKLETIARNKDKTFGPDNEGIERNNSSIISSGPVAIGLRYPLPKMYCSLAPKERSSVVVSNNAGSFVCNNLMYQVSYYYPETSFGFIHVPAHNCRNLEAKTMESVNFLEKMILAALSEDSPKKLPVLKKELQLLRKNSQNNKCRNEFFKRARGIDELDRWPF